MLSSEFKRERAVRKQLAELLKRYKGNWYWNFGEEPVKGDNMILAHTSRRGGHAEITFYIKNIRKMLDGRLVRIIEHELAHAIGANEEQAQAAEPSEDKYEGM